MSRGRVRSALFVLCAMLLAAAAAVGGYVGGERVLGRPATAPVAAVPTPAVLGELADPASPLPSASPTGTPPLPAGVSRALTSLLSDPALGPGVVADVQDALTGQTLFTADPDTPTAPASTAKLMTAVAVLTVHRATDRIATTVVRGSEPGQVVLVGGGDPTLTAATDPADAAYPDAARLADLAADVRAAGITVTSVVIDDSLFTGPSISPDWSPGDVPSSYGGAITALMADGARATPGATTRSATPDVAAAREFAALAGAPGAAISTGTAPSDAGVLGRVWSPQYADLIADMLQDSDNVVAECLARQVAIARHLPASFTGAAEAVAQVLATLGVKTSGMVDGSGLAARDRVTASVITDVLHLITDPAHADLADIVTALPVAGWSGTLADRYLSGSGASSAAGAVRAKTGTLTGVSALAGLVQDRSGRLLLFTFITSRAPSTDPAEVALDRLAAALAGCGCR